MRPLCGRGFQAASNGATKRAKITDARPTHDLRHHAGTTLLAGTGNLKVVQRLLGHTSIASTARYAHADLTDVRSALRHTYDTTTAKPTGKDSDNNAVAAPETGT